MRQLAKAKGDNGQWGGLCELVYLEALSPAVFTWITVAAPYLVSMIVLSTNPASFIQIVAVHRAQHLDMSAMMYGMARRRILQQAIVHTALIRATPAPARSIVPGLTHMEPAVKGQCDSTALQAHAQVAVSTVVLRLKARYAGMVDRITVSTIGLESGSRGGEYDTATI